MPGIEISSIALSKNFSIFPRLYYPLESANEILRRIAQVESECVSNAVNNDMAELQEDDSLEDLFNLGLKECMISSEEENAVRMKDEDLRTFIRRNEVDTTMKKSNSDMQVWKRLCESFSKRYNIENIPSTELDRLLSHFFVSICKK